MCIYIQNNSYKLIFLSFRLLSKQNKKSVKKKYNFNIKQKFCSKKWLMQRRSSIEMEENSSWKSTIIRFD